MSLIKQAGQMSTMTMNRDFLFLSFHIHHDNESRFSVPPRHQTGKASDPQTWLSLLLHLWLVLSESRPSEPKELDDSALQYDTKQRKLHSSVITVCKKGFGLIWFHHNSIALSKYNCGLSTVGIVFDLASIEGEMEPSIEIE